ncbi:DUF2752 domain-containing protein [bacterium]|nr:MAG: DUF2752 domain-containing protein [bacterium]
MLYKNFNPEQHPNFPKCPFKTLTGYQCPGCGSQRAIHYLANFKIANAFKENQLLVFSIPYLLTGYAFELIRKPSSRIFKLRKILFGKTAIYFILLVIFAFWFARNQ